MGPACGLLVTADRKTLYHAGDTGLFMDMRLIGEMNRLHVALLPIGDNYTMGMRDAVRAAEMLKAQVTIPMHYNTLDVIQAEPMEFVSRLSSAGLRARALKVGETLDY